MKLQDVYNNIQLKETGLKVLNGRGLNGYNNIYLFNTEEAKGFYSIDNYKEVKSYQFFTELANKKHIKEMKIENKKEYLGTKYFIDSIQKIKTPATNELIEFIEQQQDIDVINNYYSSLYKQEKNLEAIFEDLKADIGSVIELNSEITGKYVYIRIFRNKKDDIYFYIGQHQCSITLLNDYNLDPTYKGSGTELNCGEFKEALSFNLTNTTNEEELAELEQKIIKFCSSYNHIKPFLLNLNDTKQVFKDRGGYIKKHTKPRTTQNKGQKLKDNHLLKQPKKSRKPFKYEYLLVTQVKTGKQKVFIAEDYKTYRDLYDEVQTYFNVENLRDSHICDCLSKKIKSHRGLKFKIISAKEYKFW